MQAPNRYVSVTRTLPIAALLVMMAACSGRYQVEPQASSPPALSPEVPATNAASSSFPPSIAAPTPSSSHSLDLPQPKGCGTTLLSGSLVQFAVPSLSPDGTTLVFACGSPSDLRICTMRHDGTHNKVIVDTAEHFPDPQWSPAGGAIAIVQAEARKDPRSVENIYLISPDGQPIARITDDPSSVANAIEEIRWSPDASMIAFSTGGRIGAEHSDIYMVSADGSTLRRLTYPPAWHGTPRWSPDGKYIAYVSVSGDATALVLVDVSDGQLPERQIPLNMEGEFSWSPTATSVVYASEREENRDIYVFNLVESKEMRLTFDPSLDIEPDWSPDGSRILFRSTRGGAHEIYSMRPDGTGITREVLNPSSGFLMMPFWSTDSERFYFSRSNRGEGTYELWSSETSLACRG